ncbi:hypothetical protein TcWFU_001454 [Taenia crassiceps]|uniref:Uncharacterized protein n=1 Tax=Taenia crassiceps TaxID=6207 RepID=A0ABR4QP71_9CEST
MKMDYAWQTERDGFSAPFSHPLPVLIPLSLAPFHWPGQATRAASLHPRVRLHTRTSKTETVEVKGGVGGDRGEERFAALMNARTPRRQPAHEGLADWKWAECAWGLVVGIADHSQRCEAKADG